MSFLVGIFYFLWPALISSNYYQKSLTHLRHKAQAIKEEHAFLQKRMRQQKEKLAQLSIPQDKKGIFQIFKQLDLDTDKEGIAYYHGKELTLWLGHALDLNSIFSQNKHWPQLLQKKPTFLIKDKASVYKISSLKITPQKRLVLFRLMAFLPQFKASYLKEYHFLKPQLLQNTRIHYWDFREDVSGFEKIFSKHQDEYIGQPRLQDEIQTLFFPLRNKEKDITATVTLRSLSLSEKLARQKETILLILFLLLGISLIFLIIHIFKFYPLSQTKKFLPVLWVGMILVGLRFLFFLFSQLGMVESLSIFSPLSVSFLSFGNLTKSPADIFLTCFFLFLLIGCIYQTLRPNLSNDPKQLHPVWRTGLSFVPVFFSIFLIYLLERFLHRMIFNSNINLLHFSFNVSFLILHLSIFFFFLSLFLIIYTAFRLSALYLTSWMFSLILTVGGFGIYYLLRPPVHFFLFILEFLVVLCILTAAFFPENFRRKEATGAIFLLAALFLFGTLHSFSFQRNQLLLQNSLQNIIKTQDDWGSFLLQQSLQEIDNNKESILSYFKNPQSSDLAHSLWENSLISKFNWYSSLEIVSSEGNILSRFSMNVPKIHRLDMDLPRRKKWTLLQQSVPFLGKERNFLIGYRDWYEGSHHLGRVILSLSMDYDMLPFLYSANPYFELLRFSSMPSLNQVDFGFAVFDLKGKPLFNPRNISSGISPSRIQKITSSSESFWAPFTDKDTKYKSLYFTYNNRIYSLFLPQKTFLEYSVSFFKLFFLYLLLGFLFVFLFSVGFHRKKWPNPFWSFSNRVYISFFAVAVIPLLLFTFFTQNFFSTLFSQQYKERAEIRVNFAQRVMEDFLIFQQQDPTSLNLPPENVVLWISSTISNDVNLYQNGKLISSSRREFFDYGLLPELLDGETYYKIKFENSPLSTQTQKIGDYSFHTLTIPYSLQDSLLFISLPFPLEQQEISNATTELIEFLFFVSVFFVAGVLVFARGIGSTIIHPIRKLLSGTKEVSKGNLEISIPHKHQDEMKTLIDGFNSMVKSLKKHQQEMAEMSKKVAWAEMARKVAHEIKNPLTPIQLSAEHLLSVYQDKNRNFDQTLQESCSYIIKEVENLRKIAQEFLEFSRETELHKEPIDIKEIIQEIIAPYRNTLWGRVEFKEYYRGSDFHINGDPAKIRIVLKNLITNSIEAIPQQGQIELSLYREEKGIGLRIQDTGTGIEKKHLDRIFEPNFSTKDVGTGLGLPISKKIIEAHGGTIQVSSEVRIGTTISIFLPRGKQNFQRKD
ncbi:HAMP domain-containing histidine kinase [bacterium]|nr:HAMP domain-containing histidine kinase [bacterium]